MRLARLLWLAILTCCSLGCATTLHMKSGGELEGDVENADASFVYIILDEPPETRGEMRTRMMNSQALLGPEGARGERRRLHRVPHANIEDKLFPGKAVGIAGTVVTTVGMLVALAGVIQASGCSGDFCGFGILLITVPGAATASIGMAMMLSGWVVYANAAADAAVPETEVSLAPFVSPIGRDVDDGAAGGLSATLSW